MHEFEGMRLRARGQPITSGDKAENVTGRTGHFD